MCVCVCHCWQALGFAKDMLKELRSQELTPRNYYELYMKVLEELRYLEEFFMGLTRSGTMVRPRDELRVHAAKP